MSWLSEALAGPGKRAMDAGMAAGQAAAGQAQAAYNDQFSLANQQERAKQRAAGVLSALSSEEAANIDPTRRVAFGGVAGRGFYGGLATQAVNTALGQLKAGYRRQRESALSDALGQIQTEDVSRQQLDISRQAQADQREANRPTFFGIPV